MAAGEEAGRAAFAAKITSLGDFANQLLALVMLNVLDEKWKDHLYDLDQLRNGINYRSWGQKDPLVEYKQEAYTMFVDLMHDIYTTFTERFLRAQIVFEPPPGSAPARPRPAGNGATPTRRFNALGVLEDVPAPVGAVDIGPDESPKPGVVAKPEPTVVGAGRPRPLSPAAAKAPSNGDWATVGRNDPCPCGSGKKFKKCHGATG